MRRDISRNSSRSSNRSSRNNSNNQRHQHRSLRRCSLMMTMSTPNNKITSWNAQSASSKHHLLSSYLHNSQPAILLINEATLDRTRPPSSSSSSSLHPSYFQHSFYPPTGDSPSLSSLCLVHKTIIHR